MKNIYSLSKNLLGLLESNISSKSMLFSSAYSFNFVSSTSADVDESKAASNSAEVGRTDDIQQIGELICSFGEDNDKSWRERGRGEREREKGRKGDIKIRRAQENVGSGIIFMHTFLPMERTDRGGERISRDDFFEDGPLASCLNSREKQTKCWDAYYKVTVQKSKVEKERERGRIRFGK